MEFPYTKSVKSIPRLFEEIRKVGTPTKVTVAYLKSIGFTSSNDSYLVGLLKDIGFIDSSGVPTDRWKKYRGTEHLKVMADAVRDGYSSIFNTYPDANKRDTEAIANLIRQSSDYGADTVSRVVGSFKSLCALANFDSIADSPEKEPITPAASSLEPFTTPVVTATASGQPTINLNIQLELPPNADEKFYDTFFEAMRKHLIS